MVNAVRKAMTMLMPIPARAFMPAGDLVDARHCASFSNPLGACKRIQFCSYSYSQAYPTGRLRKGLRIGMPILGEQAASLQFAAACREPISSTTLGSRKRTFGAAAECSRLTACAPQIRGFRVRQWRTIAMSAQSGAAAFRLGERAWWFEKRLKLSARRLSAIFLG